MSSAARTRVFYDDLADDYDRIYADWPGSVSRQGRALHGLVQGLVGAGPHRVLDATCGIGTQLLGLAGHGHHLVGSDLSANALRRASAGCRDRGLTPRLVVADLRALPYRDGSFDVVVSADNSLPHLLTEDGMAAALSHVRRVLRPRGVAVVSTRDYDALLRERPRTGPPQLSTDGRGRRTVTLQIWDWADAGPTYDLTHLQATEQDDGRWAAHSRTVAYRAWTRDELTAAASEVGLAGARWIAPETSGFFQPVMVARRDAS
jgi:SAM-dependent methyltransferase